MIAKFVNRLGGGGTEVVAQAALSESGADASTDTQFVRAAFWIVLGRSVKALELRDQVREFQAGGDRQAFLLRLLASTEFRRGRALWQEATPRQRDTAAEDAALNALDSDEAFVEQAYELLLGRPADEDG